MSDDDIYDEDDTDQFYPVYVKDEAVGYVAEADDGVFNAFTLKFKLIGTYASMEQAQRAIAEDWQVAQLIATRAD